MNAIALTLSPVEGAQDFFEALAELARHHLVDHTDDETSICVEIMAESRRHPDIARLYQTMEGDIRERLAAMVAGDFDADAVTSVLMDIGDGMLWRRSVDPEFNADTAMTLIPNMVHGLLAPVGAGAADSNRNEIQS